MTGGGPASRVLGFGVVGVVLGQPVARCHHGLHPTHRRAVACAVARNVLGLLASAWALLTRTRRGSPPTPTPTPPTLPWVVTPVYGPRPEHDGRYPTS